MIILIAGASHTGKTNLAQKLLDKYKYPYLSIDHLKMGLIRSGNTNLTPYLWNIVKEMIKTAVENNQNLIVEGCYIPFDWNKDFTEEYLKDIQYYCLVMSKEYIENHFSDIKKFASVIENRMDDSDLCKEILLRDNCYNLEMCKKYGCKYVLIENKYNADSFIRKTFDTHWNT